MRDRDIIDGPPDRRRSGPAAWLALAALLVQFIVGFGHIHPEDFAALARGTDTPALSSADGPVAPSGPFNPLPSLPTHDDCAICVAMHMVGGAVLPEPATIAVPVELAAAMPAVLAELHLVARPHSSFLTRGPPRA